MRQRPSQSPDPVVALVEGARVGDPASFRELYRVNVGRVHRTVYRLAGPGADVEDLVQAVFIEGFRSLPAFRGEALFSTWLTRIAVRVCMRAVRRRHVRTVPLLDAELEAQRTPGPERTAEAREGLARLDRMLATLSLKRRTAFVLHVLDGHPLEDVAAMVGASVAAVKVRIHDARKEIDKRVRQDPWYSAFLAEREA